MRAAGRGQGFGGRGPRRGPAGNQLSTMLDYSSVHGEQDPPCREERCETAQAALGPPGGLAGVVQEDRGAAARARDRVAAPSNQSRAPCSEQKHPAPDSFIPLIGANGTGSRRISVCESSKNRPTLNQWLRLIAVGRSVGSEASAPPRRSKQDTIVIRATLRAVAQNASLPIRRLDARELLAHPVILIARKPMLNCSRGNGLNPASPGAYLRDGKQHMDDRIF